MGFFPSDSAKPRRTNRSTTSITPPSARFANCALNSGALAINAATAATFKTTATINYTVDGVFYSKAAFSAQAFPATTYTVKQGYSTFFLVYLDAAGTVGVAQAFRSPRDRPGRRHHQEPRLPRPCSSNLPGGASTIEKGGYLRLRNSPPDPLIYRMAALRWASSRSWPLVPTSCLAPCPGRGRHHRHLHQPVLHPGRRDPVIRQADRPINPGHPGLLNSRGANMSGPHQQARQQRTGCRPGRRTQQRRPVQVRGQPGAGGRHLKPTGRTTVIDPKKSGLSGDEVEMFIYSGREDGERDAVFVQLDIEGATLSHQRYPATSGSRIPLEVFEATIDAATMELFEPDPRSDGGLSIRQTPRFNYKVRRAIKQAACHEHACS